MMMSLGSPHARLSTSVYSDSMKQAFTLLARALLASCVLLLVAGCKEETTRPTYSDQAQSRIRAVEQAEMKRAAQQKQGEQDQPPPSAAPAAGGAAAASGGGPAPAARPQATPGEVAPQPYLPPSERGAYVEITETPAGSPPPPAGAQEETASGPGAAAPGGQPPVGGGTGGNMPAAVAPNPPAGAPLPPPAPPTGGLKSGGGPPAVQGPSALTAPAGAGPAAAANAELERKLREFDALMKRAQAEAERERAAGGAPSGRIEGRGGAPEDLGGAGGAASRATGSGASPDLSGEVDTSGLRRGGPSAVRMPIGEDDDIVARQLREAALRETDPVLQEKLWDEYRKYKAP